MKSSEPYWDALQEFVAEQRTAGILKNILLLLLGVILPHNMGKQLVLSPVKATFGSKARTKGICHYLSLRRCNLLSGKRICRRSNRLTKYCPFKVGFALRRDRTLSTKLTDTAHRELLYYLRDIKRKELGYG